MSTASRVTPTEFTGAPDVGALARVVEGVASRRRWEAQVRADTGERWRHLLYRGAELEVWLLGWGSRSVLELHDHGGASGAYAVVEGAVVETWTNRASSDMLRWRKSTPGTVRTMGPDVIHEMHGAASGQSLTLHCYSPPLSTMTFYERRGDEGLVVKRVESVDRSDVPAWDRLEDGVRWVAS